MTDNAEKSPADKNVLHLDGAERLPNDSHGLPSGSHGGLPAVTTSPAAEVVKQIIEQILANERRRARMEFIRLSVFFLIFLFVMLGAGVWFARQLLAQLRAERQLTEQTWRMMAGGGADKNLMSPDQSELKTPPTLNPEEVAGLEKNINDVSDLLKSNPGDSSASIREKLQKQQNAIQALNARLNEVKGQGAGAPPAADAKKIDFISAPVAEDMQLRLPVP